MSFLSPNPEPQSNNEKTNLDKDEASNSRLQHSWRKAADSKDTARMLDLHLEQAD